MALSARGPSLLPPEWRVELPMFEGPLDLLLQLVRLNEVPVTELPVARVCDQFHEYLGLMEELNLDIAGEYIYEAAQLIHLKSKMLLPRKKDVAGRVVEEDPKEDLVRRLMEYQRLKEVAQSLAEVDSVRQGVWVREPRPLDLPRDAEEEVDLGDVSLFDLLSALKTTLDRFARDNPPPFRLSRETFSVRGQVDRLLHVMGRGRPYDLLEDLRELSCRAEAIAAFLAVLELSKLNLVRLHQTDGGEIVLYRTTREVSDDVLATVNA